MTMVDREIERVPQVDCLNHLYILTKPILYTYTPPYFVEPVVMDATSITPAVIPIWFNFVAQRFFFTWCDIELCANCLKRM